VKKILAFDSSVGSVCGFPSDNFISFGFLSRTPQGFGIFFFLLLWKICWKIRGGDSQLYTLDFLVGCYLEAIKLTVRVL
jgi:hypothetical protein